MVLFNIKTAKSIARSKTITFRKIKNINTIEFALDITRDLVKCNLKSMSLDQHTDKHNSSLKNTWDKQVPEN